MNKYISSNSISNELLNLSQVVFEVTDACNLKCKYCGYGEFYEDHDERIDQYFPIKKALILLDYLSEYWLSDRSNSYSQQIYISFYGGEPLLNMAFIRQVVEYIEQLTQLVNFRIMFNKSGFLTI